MPRRGRRQWSPTVELTATIDRLVKRCAAVLELLPDISLEEVEQVVAAPVWVLGAEPGGTAARAV